jgi:hypothetical protein
MLKAVFMTAFFDLTSIHYWLRIQLIDATSNQAQSSLRIQNTFIRYISLSASISEALQADTLVSNGEALCWPTIFNTVIPACF